MAGLIDAHLHLWDPDVLDYPWLTGPLDRAFRPADLDTGGLELAGAVFVEAGVRADQSLAEVSWVESLAQDWPVLAAIVAQAPLDQGQAAAPLLRELAGRPLVRGVRHNVQGAPAGRVLCSEHVTGVRLLADLGLTADLSIDGVQLPEVTELVRLVPEVTFVLDHVGKPSAQWQPWADDLARLAAHPNVTVKLSGLATTAGADLERIRAQLSHAVATFGVDRCLAGSDWPISSSTIDYRVWMAEVSTAAGGLDHLSDTARRVYRLP
ncbi:amidohydrolase family protein [Actinoplanes sp. TRM 88003]|uniref:Amidohydrolase family protein n=1 Tax=Paractinoplanes aksuensis TaxID=2939490 RepID=A0ABT1E3Q0_9ACTN|nr:amidohydrolase family protein [Actinoplanes aksuensis]MCO8277760.1 amidohydrolase family protein [Actinoplanes aksuensis]